MHALRHNYDNLSPVYEATNPSSTRPLLAPLEIVTTSLPNTYASDLYSPSSPPEYTSSYPVTPPPTYHGQATFGSGSSTSYSPTTVLFSPASSMYSPTPAPKRRRSSASRDELEPRLKKGDEGYVKRPENAFILFRRQCCEERQRAADEADTPIKKERQADLSKSISQQWKSLSAVERNRWETLAKEKKKEHEQLHPGYVYRPQRLKGKATTKKTIRSGRGEYQVETSIDGIHFSVLPSMHVRHNRSSSISSVKSVEEPCPSLEPAYVQHQQLHYASSETYQSFGQSQSFETYNPNSYVASYYPTEPSPSFQYTYDMGSPSSSANSSTQSSVCPPTPVDAWNLPSHSAPTADGKYVEYQVQYPSYNNWDDEAALAMWPEETLSTSDFDLGAISPINLGMSDFLPRPSEDYTTVYQPIPEEQYGVYQYSDAQPSADGPSPTYS